VLALLSLYICKTLFSINTLKHKVFVFFENNNNYKTEGSTFLNLLVKLIYPDVSGLSIKAGPCAFSSKINKMKQL
jgi:hypothetical protein